MRILPGPLSVALLAALSIPAILQAQAIQTPRSRASSNPAQPLADKMQQVLRLNNEVLGLYSEAARSPASAALSSSDQAEVLERRKQALLDLIRQDPAGALGAALPPGVAAKLAKVFPGQSGKIETYGVLNGRYEVEIEDGDPASSRTFRNLRIADRRLELHFAGLQPPVESGRPIEVGGLLIGDAVVAESAQPASPKLAFEQANAGASCSTTGAQRIAVLKVKFPGTSPSLLNASLTDWMFGSSGNTLNRFWQENSAGAAWAEGDVYPAGADSWYTLDREYSCSESSALRSAALSAADGDIDYNNYSRVLIVFPPPSSGCSFAGRASIGCWVSNPDGGSSLSYALQILSSMGSQNSALQITTHEAGHMLGLYHASSADFGAEAAGEVSSAGDRLEYGDRYSTMGFWNSGHYNTPHKKRLGWIQNHQRIAAGGAYRIQPLSQAPNSSGGAVQALEVERGAGRTLWLEYRRRLGDFFSSAVENPGSGALVHLDNGSVQSLLLDFTPQSRSSGGSYYSADFYDAALNVGSSWQDPYTDLRLSVLSSDDGGLDVEVSYGATPSCVAATPSVAVSPASDSTDYPAPVNYQVAVTNNDSAVCDPSSFALGAVATLGAQTTADVAASLAQPLLTVAPGASGFTTLTATPMAMPTQATNYAVVVDASRPGDQLSDQVGLVVVPPSNTAPTVTIDSPASGAAAAQGDSLALSGSASDAEDGELSAQIAWQSDRDGGLGTGANLSVALSLGTHAITASATDAGGLTGSTSISVTVEPTAVVDIAISSVVAPAAVEQGDSASIFVTVENLGNQDVGADIAVALDASPNGGAADNSPQTIAGGLAAGAAQTLTFSWNTAGAAAGAHSLTASHTTADDDASNNARSATSTVNEPVAPFALSGIAPNSTAPDTPLIVTVTGTGFQNGAALSFQNGAGKAPAAQSVVVLNETTLTATVVAARNGPNRDRVWDVVVTNGDGASRVLPQAFTVILQPAQNRPPTVTIDAPGSGASFAAGASVAFSGSATDEEDGSLTPDLVWTSSIDGVIGSGGSFSSSSLSPGSHSVTASATDSGGATAAASVSVTVQSPSGGSTTVGAGVIVVTHSRRGVNLTGHATVPVLVSDGTAAPAGVLVEGLWTLDGAALGQPVSALTGSTGAASIDSSKFRASPGGQLAFTVTNIVLSGVPWNGLQASGALTLP